MHPCDAFRELEGAIECVGVSGFVKQDAGVASVTVSPGEGQHLLSVRVFRDEWHPDKVRPTKWTHIVTTVARNENAAATDGMQTVFVDSEKRWH